MPRYYFNLYRSDAPPSPDETGLELKSADDAKREALLSLPSLLVETLSHELTPFSVSVEIVQEGSGIVQVLTAKLEIGLQSPRDPDAE